MSKINEIQTKIKALNEGAFQKLADAYLHKKGYEPVNPLGSVIGSDKVRKGTPDTLVPLPNGKYVFAEHTTQQTDLYEKLNSDLNKCFDFEKLRLEPSHWGWEGSAVPMLQGRVTYLESLLPLLSNVDLLRQRQYVEREIQEIQTEIEWEKKRDFMEE